MKQKCKKSQDKTQYLQFVYFLFVFFNVFRYNFIIGRKMDYRDFTDRDFAFEGFVKYRKELLSYDDPQDFSDAFTELCARALGGDCIAQDCAAYFFNKGAADLLAPNYDYYMSWQILAGANGNEFALEKLEFFLNSALEKIIGSEEILTAALRRKNITKDNAVMVISNLLCEGIVDQLNIKAKDLVEIQQKATFYSPSVQRRYLNALNACIEDVVKFLVS